MLSSNRCELLSPKFDTATPWSGREARLRQGHRFPSRGAKTVFGEPRRNADQMASKMVQQYLGKIEQVVVAHVVDGWPKLGQTISGRSGPGRAGRRLGPVVAALGEHARRRQGRRRRPVRRVIPPRLTARCSSESLQNEAPALSCRT